MASPRVPEDIKRGRLTPAELEAIASLAERKFSCGRIAQRLNRHPVTVGYAMHRLGVRVLARRSFSYVRKGGPVKSFCQAEDAYLTELRTSGVPVSRIAELLTERFGHRRSDHTVRVRLVLLSNAEPTEVAQ
jgi:hypothetical protein